MTKDGITYLIALFCKIIGDNSGYLDARELRKAAISQLKSGEQTPNLEFVISN